MTDNEIVKALECSVNGKCPECPYFHSYPCDKCRNMRKDALDLINRLQEKNSNLTSDLTSLQNDLTSAKAEVEKRQGGYVTQKQEIANLEIEFKAMREAANSYKAEIERLLQKLQYPQDDTVQLMSEENIVHCKECKHLMFSDFEGECSKGYKGIVRPNDSCPFGVRERGESK